MADKVSTELIRRQASELQRLELTDERSAELAEEVAALNRAVIDAASDLDFDDEPAGFFRLLRTLAPSEDRDA